MIIMNIINVFIVFSTVLAMYISNSTAAKANGNILLGATLPYSEIDNEEVMEVVKDYKRANVKFLLVASISYIPMFFITSLPAAFLIYVFAWLIGVIILDSFMIKKYFNKIQELKRKNDWFILNKHVVNVDTEVSRLKNKMPISRLWFIPSIIINLIALLEKTNLAIVISSIITLIICILVHHFYSVKRTEVFSKNTEVNLACNYVYKRTWSIVWVLISIFTSIPCLVFNMDYSVGMVFIFLSSIMILLTVLYGYIKIRNTKNKLLMATEKVIYNDDDEYWGAFFYSNPNDSRVMVEKRIGIGTTINMGNKKGKIICIVFNCLMLAILIPVFVITIMLSNAKFSMAINGEKVVIEAPIYGTEFKKSDIKEVSTISKSKLPRGTRTNGSSTEKQNIGNFTINGYGKSLVYMNNDQNTIIIIKLKDKYIFLTGNNEEETKKYYKELTMK